MIPLLTHIFSNEWDELSVGNVAVFVEIVFVVNWSEFLGCEEDPDFGEELLEFVFVEVAGVIFVELGH